MELKLELGRQEKRQLQSQSQTPKQLESELRMLQHRRQQHKQVLNKYRFVRTSPGSGFSGISSGNNCSTGGGGAAAAIPAAAAPATAAPFQARVARSLRFSMQATPAKQHTRKQRIIYKTSNNKNNNEQVQEVKERSASAATPHVLHSRYKLVRRRSAND